ncbi:Hypothetical Protein FCC1311_013572 [Hondaea fermentalgiana]|uniref:Uncharacterized protein n=1 Tax=Hondaea fermentalgiana TaxID=2315210 RepID=A0A2R5G2A7_9STRA|nr:Hypothetical Protein FCC1311_013572 [Hondaea fermentalgiana]|eukprot:GBG25140.1 Hypothetical Protein FCC1311_013572 [Hondaea fermentalgiana]
MADTEAPSPSPESPPGSPLSPATTALAQRWKQEAKVRVQKEAGVASEEVEQQIEQTLPYADNEKTQKGKEDEEDIVVNDGKTRLEEDVVDTIDAVGTWEYLEKASEKLLEYLDKMAQVYSYSGQGTGLQNINVRNAIRARDLDASIETLDMVKAKLLDDELGPMSEDLRKEVEIFLRGFSYVRRELRQFKKDLDSLASADRHEIEQAVLAAKHADDLESASNAGDGDVANHQVNATRGAALVALDTLRARLYLELSIARRVLVRKAAKYGCVLPGRKHSLDFELAQQGTDAATEAKFQDIFAPDPPPSDPGFIIRYPSPRRRDPSQGSLGARSKVQSFRASTDARAAWRLYARAVDARLHAEDIARLRHDTAVENFLAQLRRAPQDPWARYTCDLYDDASAAVL